VPATVKAAAVTVPPEQVTVVQVRAPVVETVVLPAAAPTTIVPKSRSVVLLMVIGCRMRARADAVAVAAFALTAEKDIAATEAPMMARVMSLLIVTLVPFTESV
jgi:hypothetical protein